MDTSLHFSVKTNAKPPVPNPYSYGSYDDNKASEDYAEQLKSTSYATKANEQITISRRKFHDL